MNSTFVATNRNDIANSSKYVPYNCVLADTSWKIQSNLDWINIRRFVVYVYITVFLCGGRRLEVIAARAGERKYRREKTAIITFTHLRGRDALLCPEGVRTHSITANITLIYIFYANIICIRIILSGAQIVGRECATIMQYMAEPTSPFSIFKLFRKRHADRTIKNPEQMSSAPSTYCYTYGV